MSQNMYQTITHAPRRLSHCGCFIFVNAVQKFLPQVHLDAHTVILSSFSRTTLTQTFVNPNINSPLQSVRYTFPIFDGVSIVGFTCTIDSRTIRSVIKERNDARKTFDDAVGRGELAGHLEQSVDAADIFTVSLGNVPPGEAIKVNITYLGKLSHDAEVNGLRFTMPLGIAPRYGKENTLQGLNRPLSFAPRVDQGISITIDAEIEGSAITSIQSPSHPISITIGTTSMEPSLDPSLQRASVSLSLGSTKLDQDFVIQIGTTDLSSPAAILETHPVLPNQRALMATLIPMFNLPTERPEMVFLCDRSRSMAIGNKLPNLIAALQIFLKSLPMGIKFNICSFGSQSMFLWQRSKTCDRHTVDEAISHISSFSANLNGTEIYAPLRETFKRRYNDMNLEVFLLTDGETWSQYSLFDLVNEEAKSNTTRVFTLGIGQQVSSALIEGIARAGNGVAQYVGDNEKMDKKVIRMLKAALTPHIKDYTLEIKYEKVEADDDCDFELVERVTDALMINTFNDAQDPVEPRTSETTFKQPISLFNPESLDGVGIHDVQNDSTGKYGHLPKIDTPRYLQSPSIIPPLFPFFRSTVFVMLSGSQPTCRPKSVFLKGTSAQGPLELEIPITEKPKKAITIHQLAAHHAIKELEEGRGWLSLAKDDEGKLLKDKFEGRFSDILEREAVRLGLQYQMAGKHCSFVATQEYSRKVLGETDSEDAVEFEVVQNPTTVQNPTSAQNPTSVRQFASSLQDVFFPGTIDICHPLSTRDVLGDFDFDSFLSDSADDVDHFDFASAFEPLTESLAPISNNTKKRSGSDVVSNDLSGAPSRSLGIKKSYHENSTHPRSLSHVANLEKETLSAPVGYRQDATSAAAVQNGTGLAGSPLTKLALLQSFSGNWRWSQELELVLGVAHQQATQCTLPGMYPNHADILATLCALVYMKKRLTDEKEVWEMIAGKAEKWLRDQTAIGINELERTVIGLFK
ncbi:hypothetical protein S40293_07062 [Stachybotrys chartarum IBT 40293]|nr:hypothetical protein S40293_07062 [Stachybotrys chartarum IBT 40293]